MRRLVRASPVLERVRNDLEERRAEQRADRERDQHRDPRSRAAERDDAAAAAESVPPATLAARIQPRRHRGGGFYVSQIERGHAPAASDRGGTRRSAPASE